MSPRKRKASPDVQVRMTPPELHTFIFIKREANAQPDDAPGPALSFSLGLTRLALEAIGIEFTLEIDGLAGTEIKVVYRAQLAVEAEGMPSDKLENELRQAVSYLAPAVLYPYMRETISTAVLKAGMKQIMPPIVNFREIFVDTEVAMPPQLATEEA